MYAYIKGTLVQCDPSVAIVDVNGVGYQIAIPTSVFEQLPPIESEVTLFTSFIVREASQTLFGFTSSEEKDVFDTLLSVSGVGPKLALAMIGHLELPDLQQAIANSDIRTISKVPGIGKRTAERLIVELRDKLPALFPGPKGKGSRSINIGPESSTTQDAMSALINLGYTQARAQKALEKSLESLPENAPLPEVITAALKAI